MFSCSGEGDFLSVEGYIRDEFGVLDNMAILVFIEDEKTGLVRNQLNLVLIAVLDGNEEKIVEVSDVIGDEDGIVSESDTGDGVNSELNSKFGKL